MLLDTSGLYCYFDKDDRLNDLAVEHFESSDSMLVTDYVLAEFVPLCHVRGLNRTRTLDFVEAILTSPLIETVWTTETHYLHALALLKLRKDKSYSICDAVSFRLMAERGLTEALTTDKRFEQEGFIRLLK